MNSPKLMATDATLTITIENTRPIELSDLTNSLQSLGRQYSRYLSKNKVRVTPESKLYVQEVRNGSAVFELIDLLPVGLAFANAENFNTLIDFGKNLGEVYKWFIGKGPKPKEELREPDLKNYEAILSPVAKDSGSQMLFTGNFNDSPITIYQVNSLEANAAQNSIGRLINEQRLIQPGGYHENVVFYLHVFKNQPTSGTGEKGVIESISQLPIKVTFASDTVKAEIGFIQGQNPMLIGFIVDVQVETIQGKPVLYNILRVRGQVEV